MMQGKTGLKLPLKPFILLFMIAAVVGGVGAVARPSRPDGGSGFFKPTTQAALQAAIQEAFNECYVLQLDPTTRITATSTINITVDKDCGQKPRGVDGHGASIEATITNGTDVMRITSTTNVRGLFIQAIHISGGFYTGLNAGNCLVIVAPKNKAIYKATLRDIYVDYCSGSGLVVKGDFFESLIDNLQTENHGQDGIVLDHGDDGGILSNVMLRAPNISRNRGYGLHALRANSIDISQGSVINNWKGGLLGERGLRTVDSVNCENSGPVCVDIPTSDFPTRIVGTNASTDGATRGKGPGSGPMLYAYRYGGAASKLIQSDNYITFYGSGKFTGAIRAP
jgi:hypothetical protein